MVRAVGLGLILAALWLLLSGYFKPLLLGFGAASVVGTVLVVRRMGVLDEEAVPLHLLGRAFVYWPWLIWEIVKANIDVARIIVHPRLPISPTLVRVKASQKTELGRVTYANSITLTPGTVSVDTQDSMITVHALTRAGADSLQEGEMDRRVTWFEGAR